ncbi:MAG: RNA polymerase sigma factor [Planctomycetota bacterium]
MTETAGEGLESVQLSAAIARGDEEAFAEFYELWFDRAFAMVRTVSRRDESFCLDVVQDCMMKVVKSMRPMKTEKAVAAWMGKVVLNMAVDHLRGEKRRRRREAERIDADGTGPRESVPQALEEQERLLWMQKMIADLPAGDRELILQRFGSGKTLSAVGEELGISGNAAHGRIRRILARWRETAKEYFS